MYGGRDTNTYLLETTGTGVAALDYDGDGWLDVFLVNGTTLEGFPKGQEPTNHLYRNRGDGTFEDVTARAGLAASGWGQGACAGDYDNDGTRTCSSPTGARTGCTDNTGDGTFEDVTQRAGLVDARVALGHRLRVPRLRPRRPARSVRRQLHRPRPRRRRRCPTSGLCRYKGLAGRVRPAGTARRQERALPQPMATARSRTCRRQSGITRAKGTYGLGVSTLDFDDDGWVDLYVANDSNPSALYRNNRRRHVHRHRRRAPGCAYSQDGKPQAGMGVAIGDYDRNGTMDIFKTNFAGDTSTLYANTGKGFCEDRTFASGIGVNTRWLGWGVGFVDLDNDGWLDLFLVNGHVYPEVEQLKTEAGYKQRKVVYRNLRNGRFEDVTDALGPPVTTAEGRPRRGVRRLRQRRRRRRRRQQRARHAGSVPPRSDRRAPLADVEARRHPSNRSAIGARVRLVTADGEQRQEVRGGGSYYSQNDLRAPLRAGSRPRHRARDRALAERPRGDLDRAWRPTACMY